jgi:hypothetical protein
MNVSANAHEPVHASFGVTRGSLDRCRLDFGVSRIGFNYSDCAAENGQLAAGYSEWQSIAAAFNSVFNWLARCSENASGV